MLVVVPYGMYRVGAILAKARANMLKKKSFFILAAASETFWKMGKEHNDDDN
ncbi:MAG: hypothetical protein ACQEXV_00715 [Bacillota bacterium]